MEIKIRRFHVVLVICSTLLLTAVVTYSRKHTRGLKEITAISHKDISLKAAPNKQVILPSSIHADVPRVIKANAPKKRAKPYKPAARKKIAFTFDDGPHPAYTERLLKLLKKYKVPATFFIVGKQVKLYPHLLKKIFRDGHELANHTYTHRDIRTLSYAELSAELDVTSRLVESITDQKMKFFRPPGGQYDQKSLDTAVSLGYTMVLWTSFPQDHAHPPTSVIKRRVFRSARKDGIILLHSGVENTLRALPAMIRTLRKKGYSFVTMSDLDTQSYLSLIRQDTHAVTDLSSLPHKQNLQ